MRRDQFAINVDISSVNSEALLPIACRFPQRESFHFDGVFSVFPGPGNVVRAYSALFKNGIIEALDTGLRTLKRQRQPWK